MMLLFSVCSYTFLTGRHLKPAYRVNSAHCVTSANVWIMIVYAPTGYSKTVVCSLCRYIYILIQLWLWACVKCYCVLYYCSMPHAYFKIFQWIFRRYKEDNNCDSNHALIKLIETLIFPASWTNCHWTWNWSSTEPKFWV